MLAPITHSQIIKDKALKLGFDACGISKANALIKEGAHLKKWLDEERQGEMKYLTNYFEKRTDPRKLVEGAKSVISVLLNYFPEKTQNPDSPVVSKYAYGEDYHGVMKRKLKDLLVFIQQKIGPVHGRVFVDSAPVLERAWAVRAGLGWIGKNGMLISRAHGSFVFLGELIVDMELEYNSNKINDYCGTCTQCIDACPTNAIIKPRVVDGSKCISYFTIEKKGDIPAEMKGQFQNRLFGCDICQEVCPWNRKIKTSQVKEFQPSSDFLEMTLDDWYDLSEEGFNNKFYNSALKRAKYKGLKRNLKFLQ